MTNTNLLLLDLFVHGQGWIPSIQLVTHSVDHPVIVEYNGEEYVLDNPLILSRIPNDIDTIIVPESIFDEIIGDSPDRLPTAKIDSTGQLKVLDVIPSANTQVQHTLPKNRVLDLVATFLLLNYIGIYDLAWKLQKDIYIMREYLPSQWRNIGGITLNRSDEKMRKWNGDLSPFMKSQFNGMYAPYGLSDLASPRYILHSNVSYHSEMHLIQQSQYIQDLSFGIIPSIMELPSDLLHSIAIVGTGRDITKHISNDVICIPVESISIPPVQDINENMSIEEIISAIQSNESLIPTVLSTMSMDNIRKIAESLIDKMPLQSVVRSWDLFSFSPDEKKCNCIPSPLMKVIETDERVETMEEMDEDSLVTVANALSVQVPYEDGDISVSQLINDLQKILSELLQE